VFSLLSLPPLASTKCLDWDSQENVPQCMIWSLTVRPHSRCTDFLGISLLSTAVLNCGHLELYEISSRLMTKSHGGAEVIYFSPGRKFQSLEICITVAGLWNRQYRSTRPNDNKASGANPNWVLLKLRVPWDGSHSCAWNQPDCKCSELKLLQANFL
jgi:hypothetical protein